MEQLKFDPQAPLADFDYFTEKLIVFLASFRISTIGQLLQATKGLSDHLEIFESPEEKAILDRLNSEIATETLSGYQDFQYPGKFGLNKKPEENESNSL